jgi:MASE1
MTASGLMLRLGALFAAYFAGAVFGIALTRHAGNIAPFWPPNALLLAVLLRSNFSRWPLWLGGTMLAAFAANMLLIGEPALGAMLSAVNVMEVVVSAGLMRRFAAGQPITLAEGSHLLAFAAFGGIAGPGNRCQLRCCHTRLFRRYAILARLDYMVDCRCNGNIAVRPTLSQRRLENATAFRRAGTPR